jgi:hypothetical protein
MDNHSCQPFRPQLKNNSSESFALRHVLSPRHGDRMVKQKVEYPDGVEAYLEAPTPE